MDVVIEKSRVAGEIAAIPSKSYAHRIAICNFLAGEAPFPGCNGFTSKDIEATIRCLSALRDGESILDCGESGSTLRFLLPLSAAVGGEYMLVGHGKLMERPNEELFNVLSSHGVSVKKGDGIKIKGKLIGGEYVLRGDISSQYISGLLMALPTLESDSKIVLTTELVSVPYVEITLEVLKAFGIKIEKKDNVFYIRGGQKYGGNISAEGDWSNAAFFLVLGAVAGDIKVTNLKPDSVQGDKKIISVLELAGANVQKQADGYTVKKSELKAFTLDAGDCPDIVPITAVLAACSEGISVIKNIERLKIKESDRVESSMQMLLSFGIKSTTDGHQLKVYGGKPFGGTVNSYNDHRIAMSAAVLGAIAEGKTIIKDAGAVNKSYPTFFEHFNKVGGNASEL